MTPFWNLFVEQPSYFSSQQKDFETHRNVVILSLHMHMLLALLFIPP